jgi:hypothetical protein
MSDYYHFLMPTSEMHPRIYLGERVIFDKSEAPEIDDDVVIVLANGEIKVRLLVEIADEYFVVSTYEPASAERLNRASVANVWPVAWREAPDRYEQLRGGDQEEGAARA